MNLNPSNYNHMQQQLRPIRDNGYCVIAISVCTDYNNYYRLSNTYAYLNAVLQLQLKITNIYLLL